MTGDALVRELQERYPGIRAILMSGYSDEHLEERVRTDGSLPLMRKPFSTKELARRVREVLDAP
jgi:FixJ family two-component response regulator